MFLEIFAYFFAFFAYFCFFGLSGAFFAYICLFFFHLKCSKKLAYFSKCCYLLQRKIYLLLVSFNHCPHWWNYLVVTLLKNDQSAITLIWFILAVHKLITPLCHHHTLTITAGKLILLTSCQLQFLSLRNRWIFSGNFIERVYFLRKIGTSSGFLRKLQVLNILLLLKKSLQMDQSYVLGTFFSEEMGIFLSYYCRSQEY